MIYLDNAATTSPKPAIVIEKLLYGTRQYSANPGRSGHAMSIRCAEKLYECRKNISDFFGLETPERCVFTHNCTTAINMVLKGTLQKGDHVIISDLEHNAAIRPLNTLSFNGIEVSKAHFVRSDIEATVKNFRNAIRKNTRLIFCTHASNVTGDVLPVIELSKLASEHGILFGTDAAQSSGLLPLSMKESAIDFICIPSHKGLYGPMGCGALLMSKRAKLRALIEGGTGNSSVLPFQPDDYPERLESGTVNLPGIIGMSTGVDFVRTKGSENILRHELEYCRQLEYELERLDNITVHSSKESKRRTPITTITVQGRDSEYVSSYLSDMGFAVRGGLHCAPEAHRAMGTLNGGAVRIAPSCFTDYNHIPMLVNALKKC